MLIHFWLRASTLIAMCFLTTVANAAFVCEDLFVHVQTNSTAEYAKALARVFHHAQVGIWFKRLGESQGSIDIVDSVAQSAVRIEINRAKNHSRKTDWHALDVAETKRSISLLGEHLFWYDKDAVVVEANQHQTRVIVERNGAPEEPFTSLHQIGRSDLRHTNHFTISNKTPGEVCDGQSLHRTQNTRTTLRREFV